MRAGSCTKTPVSDRQPGKRSREPAPCPRRWTTAIPEADISGRFATSRTGKPCTQQQSCTRQIDRISAILARISVRERSSSRALTSQTPGAREHCSRCDCRDDTRLRSGKPNGVLAHAQTSLVFTRRCRGLDPRCARRRPAATGAARGRTVESGPKNLVTRRSRSWNHRPAVNDLRSHAAEAGAGGVPAGW